jgi:hypothetical protein
MAAGNDITNLIRFIRMDIGDDGSTQTFSDTQLVTIVQKATIRVDTDIAGCLSIAASGGFIQFEQSVSGSTFLASGIFVLPSGAPTNGLPDNLLNLVTLKSECLLAKRAHFDAAGKAIRVRDGDTEIDTSVGFGGLRDLTAGEGGPCVEYKKSLEDYCKWVDDELNGDITQWANIIWKGNTRKFQSHSQLGAHGDLKTEIMADFSDYLRGHPHSHDGADHHDTGPDISR